MDGIGGGAVAWVRNRHWAAWVVSGLGLALAGLSLWYLIVVQALYIGVASGSPFAIALRVLEVVLLASFSVVLIYGGYWLAASQFDRERVWWAGLWTMVGLAGIVAIVAFMTAIRLQQGGEINEPTIIQELLLAAGGGALAGLLIGVSTIRETIHSETTKEQRNTLLFVNELLRHNVLNGMTVVLGNTEILRDHVDEEGEQFLDATEDRARTVVELIENVRTLMRSVSGELSLEPTRLEPVLTDAIQQLRDANPAASVELQDDVGNVEVVADELLTAVFENVLANAVEHHDDSTPHVEVTVEEGPETVRVHVADDGPGVPDEFKEQYFAPGEQREASVGQGLGLYLVDTLVERYGGDVWLEDNEPRGTVVTVELPRPD